VYTLESETRAWDPMVMPYGIFVYKNNMEDQCEKSGDKIKVAVKTPRDKKEVHVEGNGTIKQVNVDY